MITRGLGMNGLMVIGYTGSPFVKYVKDAGEMFNVDRRGVMYTVMDRAVWFVLAVRKIFMRTDERPVNIQVRKRYTEFDSETRGVTFVAAVRAVSAVISDAVSGIRSTVGGFTSPRGITNTDIPVQDRTTGMAGTGQPRGTDMTNVTRTKV